jgi:hypothetical protein
MAHYLSPQGPYEAPLSGSFDSNWTIETLLEAVAHLESPDVQLAPHFRSELHRIERALGEMAGAPAWVTAPSTTALLRSIAALCAHTPALRAVHLSRVLDESHVTVLT